MISKCICKIPSHATGKLQMSFKDIIFVVAIIMNRYEKVFLILLCLMVTISLHAQSFADYFADKTLRVDLSLPEMQPNKNMPGRLSCLPSWAGSIIYLELPLQGMDKSLCEMQPMAA